MAMQGARNKRHENLGDAVRRRTKKVAIKYHAAAINRDTHNVFEEVPTLGDIGDVLMSMSADDDNANVETPVEVPAGSALTENLLGWRRTAPPTSFESKQRLRH